MSETLCTLIELLIGSIIIAQAAYAAIIIWKTGSIFERARAYVEARNDIISELMGCSLCLATHVTFWLTASTLLPVFLLTKSYSQLLLLPLCWYASIFWFVRFDRIWPISIH